MSNVIHGSVNLDKAALDAYQRDQQSRPKSTADAVLEAAATDPIGMAILARRVVYGESYDKAVAAVGLVTEVKISPTAARMRVSRLSRSLAAAVLE